MDRNLPWKIRQNRGYFEVKDVTGEAVFDDGSAGGQYGQICIEETANFIITACNSYYENKAKADLFDEAINQLKWIVEQVAQGHDRISIAGAKKLLTRANQLTKGE
jgi:hypothetical protein